MGLFAFTIQPVRLTKFNALIHGFPILVTIDQLRNPN